MLIRDAELEDGSLADVRTAGDRIAAIGGLEPLAGEAVLDARGGLLLPGLHDHHIHLAGLATSLSSVKAGPPDVMDAEELAVALRRPGTGWLRAIGYHESVAGMLDRATLDRMVADRPVRVQHRSGRMWFLNSAAMDLLLCSAAPPPGLDRTTGRLFDEDAWLRAAIAGRPPAMDQVGTLLARHGVTGVTDMSPTNDVMMATHFADEIAQRALPQRLLLAGSPSLTEAELLPGITIGPVKLHLHEAALPDFDEAVATVRAAHDDGRGLAVHCATEVELVFALALFDTAGTTPKDRIEHASVAADHLVAEIARVGLAVCTQPQFIAERGDAYLRDVAEEDRPHLYRLRAFLDAYVPLAGGSDAPFGGADPWAGMAAAISRRSRDGFVIGGAEALTAEEAIDLYLRDPVDLRRRRRVIVDAPADLCLLVQPWREAREQLNAGLVAAVMISGDLVHQAPA